MSDTAKDPTAFSATDKKKLKKHVDAIDAIAVQQADLAAQKKELMEAAELDGFSKKRINDVLKKRKMRRKKTKAELDQAQLEFELYWDASGGDKFADALEDDELEVDDDPPARGRGGRGFN